MDSRLIDYGIEMEKEFWIERWSTGRTRFHQNQINPHLETFWPEIAKDKRPVLVPLCGKSKDMTYLANKGHKVVGVEFSEQAIVQFFEEIGVKPMVRNCHSFKCFESPNYQIWCGDLFQLDINFAKVAYVYDRASYIALDKDLRKKYRQWLNNGLSHAQVLLICIEFDNDAVGPPFTITDRELQEGFSHHFDLSLLFDEAIDKESGPHGAATSYLIERVYRLVGKSQS